MSRKSILLFQLCLLIGCAHEPPTSFSRITAPGWLSFEMRESIDYDRAWKVVLGILVREFDLEVLSKEDGYIRTAWLYSWTGEYQSDYRVRVTAKFSDDRKKLDIKSEAQIQYDSKWIMGVDTRLLTTLKTDLMGTIGRVTR